MLLFYRDLKPDNIAYELGNQEKVFLIDFGLAKIFQRKGEDGEMIHIEQKEGRDLVGTVRYRVISQR